MLTAVSRIQGIYKASDLPGRIQAIKLDLTSIFPVSGAPQLNT